MIRRATQCVLRAYQRNGGRQVAWCTTVRSETGEKAQPADQQAPSQEEPVRNETEQEQIEQAEPETPVTPEKDPVQQELDQLKTQNTDLSEQIAQLKHAYLSSKAEAENARRIAARDVDNARKRALKNFAKDLLEVRDNFDRALQTTPDSVKAAESPLHNLFQGVAMTDSQLSKVLAKHGVQKIDIVPLETEFHHDWHEAVVQSVVEGAREGLIAEVLKEGYTLNGEVLRAPQVVVTLEDPGLAEQ